MGKNKRATRKELEKVIGRIIGTVNALDNYLGLYIEFKKDTSDFSKYIEDRLSKNTAPNLEVSKKGERQSRYNKLTQKV